MTDEFSRWVLYFTIYSFLGYLIEVIFCSIRGKKLVQRGFLFGPVVPLYGFGAILVLWSTTAVRDDPWLTFWLSLIICTALEYITGVLLEKLFHLKWWDYSKKHKLQVGGKIFLGTSLGFGFGGCMIVYFFQKYIDLLIDNLPPSWLSNLALISLVLFFLDTVISVYATQIATTNLDLQNIIGDQTNEIKRAARKVLKQVFLGVEQGKERGKRWLKKQQRAYKKELRRQKKLTQKTLRKTFKGHKKP
ncbi:MAG: putative ABC transporter permease [Candidatus Saccharibacteria bacterium]|nr:putative ABC transporter permease [Candidatus Saccharibacteria bacterium]